MTEGTSVSEPEPEEAQPNIATREDEPRDPLQLPIFSLSGGLMRSSVTGNRIDGLLSKMLQRPDAVRYVRNVDRNLDYLITSLQLDMIRIIADECSRREEPRDHGALRTEMSRFRGPDDEE